MEDSSTTRCRGRDAAMGRRLAWAAGAMFVLAAAATAVGQSYRVRSVRDGVFSAAQVERGRESFEWICMECHEIEEFTGAGAYLEEMDGASLWEVFDYVWAEMPEDRPGWLEPEEYADVLSYILSVYGMPAGDEDMPIERTPLEAIVIEGPAPTG